MMEHLISLFIDNEMNLDEKITFVETVHSEDDFAQETISLLEQEKMLRDDVVDIIPAVVLPERKLSWFLPWRRMLIYCGSGLTAAAILFLMLLPGIVKDQGNPVLERVPYRFVIYRPDARQAEIVGSFTNWRAVPMNRVDDYWQITLELPIGENRFAYIIDGRRPVSDPTIPEREKDDFGGENSILEVQWSI